MEAKEVEIIDNPVAVAGVTLIPVAKVSIGCWPGKRSISFSGVKQPIIVVIASPSTRKAFRITGEEVPLDQLAQEVPRIKEILDCDSSIKSKPKN